MSTTQRRISGSICLIAFLVLLGAGDAPHSAKIDDAMKVYVAANGAPGVITLVADKDRILHLSAVGMADIESKRPMKTDDIIWIASMTKPVTAVGILMLADQGKLSIDDPVAKYLPETAGLKKPNGEPGNITIRQCLNHTSGLSEATQPERDVAVDLTALMRGPYSRALVFDPGSQYRYSDAGINTLARVIEAISKQTFQDWLQANLFGPLGMTQTTFYPTEEQMKRHPTSYTWRDGRWEPAPVPVLNGHKATDRNRYAAGNGGLYCTTEDYLLFARMLLNQGTLNGRQYLKPETVRQMTSLQTGNLPDGSYGFGVTITRSAQGADAGVPPSYGHGGRYGTEFLVDPVKGRIYIHMIQRNGNGAPDSGNLPSLFRTAAAGL